jgi:hypothetical protein
VPPPAPVQRLVLAALSLRLRLTNRPVYIEMARLTAFVGLLAHPTTRRIAAAAVHAMGMTASRATAWRFAWDWWY